MNKCNTYAPWYRGSRTLILLGLLSRIQERWLNFLHVSEFYSDFWMVRPAIFRKEMALLTSAPITYPKFPGKHKSETENLLARHAALMIAGDPNIAEGATFG